MAQDTKNDTDKTTPDSTPVVESASATTDHAANKSGNAAYVIAGAVLVVLCLLVSSVTSCASNLVENLGSYYDYGYSDGNSYGYDDGNSYGYDDGTYGSYGDSATTDLTQADALSYDLYLYSYTISSSVSATAYSGAQTSVTNFSRTLVSIDKSANSDLVKHLRAAAAATDDATISSELEQASAVATTAISDLKSLSLPTDEVQGSSSVSANDIVSYLSDAQDEALDRWSDISSIIAAMQEPDGKTRQDFEDLDNSEDEHTMNAGNDLVEALSLSDL